MTQDRHKQFRIVNPNLIPTDKIRFNTWAKLFLNEEEDQKTWNASRGYIKPCCCGDGEYHLILNYPHRAVKCLKREEFMIIEYLTLDNDQNESISLLPSKQ